MQRKVVKGAKGAVNRLAWLNYSRLDVSTKKT